MGGDPAPVHTAASQPTVPFQGAWVHHVLGLRLINKTSVYIRVWKILKPSLGNECETINVVFVLFLHSFTFFPRNVCALQFFWSFWKDLFLCWFGQVLPLIQNLRLVTITATAVFGTAGQDIAVILSKLVVWQRCLLRTMQDINYILWTIISSSHPCKLLKIT